MILFPYINGKLITQSELKENYPKCWQYLSENQYYLENREKGKMKGEAWYAYGRSQALTTVLLPKIITPDYYSHASYGFDINGEYLFCGGGAGGYGILIENNYEPKYVLGLLNSRLLDWYLHKISLRAYQTAYMYVKKYIAQLPIRMIDCDNVRDNGRHDKIVKHVNDMVNRNNQLAIAKTNHEKNVLQRQIDHTNKQIDLLVYELYGLTDEEIQIVESNL